MVKTTDATAQTIAKTVNQQVNTTDQPTTIMQGILINEVSKMEHNIIKNDNVIMNGMAYELYDIGKSSFLDWKEKNTIKSAKLAIAAYRQVIAIARLQGGLSDED